MSRLRHTAFSLVLALGLVLFWFGQGSPNEQTNLQIRLEKRQAAEIERQNSVGHQNPQLAPPLPIQELSHDYIVAQQSASGVNATQNTTLSRRYDHSSSADFNPLFRRAVENCGDGEPCADGSCCGPKGICGYGPEYCGKGNCTSNCDATAMCGMYSEDADVACGMNLCCSFHGWCGTTELYCGNTLEGGPCQEGYGSCQVIPPPSCGASGSTGGRTIGYYQSWNVRQRLCNRIEPSQIDTTGLTHLYFAFASMDPNTFGMTAANEADIDMFTEFTNLKTSSLQTWIAVGGFDFSDANAATHTTWSDMVSTSANRAAFIASAMTFMDQYGFQGLDLDWEYPVAEVRGGKKGDMENFVYLVKEMRAAFGTKYGISLTLAPDYWYLRYFDAKAMEPYVDFFGFMSYDLHGSWDSDVKTLGSIVRGQADIREIYTDIQPLWFDGLNPAKINFGLAYYGRGYTVSDSSCAYMGCAFSGPSKAAPCTNAVGVMSLREIESIIKEKGLVPEYLADPMMKQISWDDQWIGYDDLDTITKKKAWADEYCFGGTMIWSVDFLGTGSGDSPDGKNAPVLPTTTDGTCGKDLACGDWSAGGCCSSSGFCGSSDAHCGGGCQNGPCWKDFETTDGTCGAAFGNSFCGSWSQGACCSSSGFCGDTDAHCGDGCQSGPCDNSPSGSGENGGGGNGEDVYIDPAIWSSASPQVTCDAPCNLILPPVTLPTPTTISFPPITTSLEVAWPSTTTIVQNGKTTISTGFLVLTETTTITVPALTTSIIDVWNINWTETGVSDMTYTVTTSVVPPIIILTDKPPSSTQSGFVYPPQTRTFQPPPWPTGYDKPSKTTNGHTVPPVTAHSGKQPGPTCRSGCGSKCKIFCPDGHGGCGFSCFDLSSNWPDPHGPHPNVPNPDGPNPNPPSGPPPGGSPPDGSDPTSKPTSTATCTKSTTREELFVTCHATTTTGAGSATVSCDTKTSTITGCDLTASATTTTTTATATCWQYSLTGDHVPDVNSDDSDPILDAEFDKKRSIIGRRVRQGVNEAQSLNPELMAGALVKRAGKVGYGACVLTTDKQNGINIPKNPNAEQMQSSQFAERLSEKQYWYLVDTKECMQLATISWNSGSKLHSNIIKSKPQVVNVDHVYEKALPGQFLDTLFTNDNQDQCSAFTSTYYETPDGNFVNKVLDKGSVDKAGQSRLQSLINLVPNFENFRFMGMDFGVNGMKGVFFNPQLAGKRKIKSTDSADDIASNLNIWNLLGMAIDIMNMDITKTLFSDNQKDIYGGFVKFDELWPNGCNPLNFAEGYKTYMKDLLQANIVSIQAYASEVSSSVVHYATATSPDETPIYSDIINQLNQRWPPSAMSFPTESYLQFPDVTANIQKRQAACTKNIKPSASASSGTGSGDKPLCIPHQDPAAGASGSYCVCDDGKTNLPFLQGSNPCGYTSIPTSVPTTKTTPATTAWTSTTTDFGGNIVACTSFSKVMGGSKCVGSTIYTAPTSAPPPSGPTGNPTQKLQIMYGVEQSQGIAFRDWYFWADDYEINTNLCDTWIQLNEAPDHFDSTDPVFPDFPDGVKIKGKIDGHSNCLYTGSADSAGKLHCDNLDAECYHVVAANNDGLSCTIRNGFLVGERQSYSLYSFTPVVMCSW